MPAGPLALEEQPHDPDDAAQAGFYGGVFGYRHLQPKIRADVLAEVNYVAEMCGGESVEDSGLDDYGGSPFLQGRPRDGCPDSGCPNHARPASLRTRAIFDAAPDELDEFARSLWGSKGGDLQIIYQMCPLCSAIMTSNQCD